MGTEIFTKIKEKDFQVLTISHAEAILKHDMPDAANELETALLEISIPAEELIRGGGGECGFTQRLRKRLSDGFGWKKHNFEIKKIIDGAEKESISHEIDHVKQFSGHTFALEIEWNNKDPFYDRDLENFKRLHAEGVISIGAIITRGTSLQEGLRNIAEQFAKKEGFKDLNDVKKYYPPTTRQQKKIERAVQVAGTFEQGWAHVFVADKYGSATTHWQKLQDRVNRGVGNPCPLLLIGIPLEIVVI